LAKKSVARCGAVLATALVLAACPGASDSTAPKTPEIPFQGPLNASFETAAGWVLSSSPDVCNNALGAQRATIVTSTGFLPSAGIQYASLASCNWLPNPGHQASIFQDQVDLTHSTTLSFDYSLNGTVGAGGGTVTAQILFTSNGTATLWTKSLTSGSTLPIQKLNEVIALPTTTVSGRLTITLVGTGGQNPSSKSDIVLGIDNIVVK
jgi:hypothetical protein